MNFRRIAITLCCLALIAPLVTGLPLFACPPAVRQVAACYPQQQAYYAPVQAQILAYPVALQFAVPTVAMPVQMVQPMQPPQPVPASVPMPQAEQVPMQVQAPAPVQVQVQAQAPVIIQRQVQAYYAAPVALAPVAVQYAPSYAVGSYAASVVVRQSAVAHVPVRQRVVVRQHVPARQSLRARIQANRAVRVTVAPRIAVATPRATVIIR